MRAFLQSRFKGFTLVELMITVAVVGILSAIAYPAFTSAIQRSRRSDAMAALTAISQAQERYRSNHNSYATEIGSDGLKMQNDISKLVKYYTISMTGLGATASFTSGYILTATAIEGSSQDQDTYCVALSMKLEGAVFSYLSADKSGSDTSTNSNARCWAR